VTPSALDRLQAQPRLSLAFLPTPLLRVSHLRTALGEDAPSILVKMDAWTGFALGGNKVRKLEFVLGREGGGVDTLITCGGPQSNHARITAGAAAHLGMDCVLVINGETPDPPRGNALLHRLYGARIRTVKGREERAPAMEEEAETLRARGRRPLVIPLGASTPLGALGYASAAVELDRQMEEGGGWPAGTTWIFVSASSCGTLAGLALGFSILGRENVRLVGVSADVSAGDMLRDTGTMVREGGELLGWDGDLPENLVIPAAEYVGEGYGIPTPESRQATELFARRGGIVLDPVYTAKVGAGFLDWLRQGKVPKNDTALFWHTGGAPGLLA